MVQLLPRCNRRRRALCVIGVVVAMLVGRDSEFQVDARSAHDFSEGMAAISPNDARYK
jgi:hypothetical protein